MKFYQSINALWIFIRMLLKSRLIRLAMTTNKFYKSVGNSDVDVPENPDQYFIGHDAREFFFVPLTKKYIFVSRQWWKNKKVFPHLIADVKIKGEIFSNHRRQLTILFSFYILTLRGKQVLHDEKKKLCNKVSLR